MYLLNNESFVTNYHVIQIFSLYKAFMFVVCIKISRSRPPPPSVSRKKKILLIYTLLIVSAAAAFHINIENYIDIQNSQNIQVGDQNAIHMQENATRVLEHRKGEM